MRIENIDLYNYFCISKQQDTNGKLTCYIHDTDYPYNETTLRPAMVILPGGAYTHLSPREAEPVALKYFAEGFNCFVLNYSVRPLYFPTQLIEGCGAIIYIRENAEKLHIQKDKVCILGFSAGGHLASCIATMNQDERVKGVFNERVSLAKPNACIFSYSVFSDEFSNSSSIEIVCNGDKELIDYCSVDKRVNKETPPAFFWATANDKSVSVLNTLLMATAYKKNDIPFEMHIFEEGKHGLSLATKETSNVGEEEVYCVRDVARWFKMSLNFLNRHAIKMEK